jgi:hypothetical protein
MLKTATDSEILKHDKVTCSFAEAVYQEMASFRYGIDFCCKLDEMKYVIKKELIEYNNLKVCLDDPSIQANLIIDVTTAEDLEE